jgi:uncharacterized protein with PIN domain
MKPSNQAEEDALRTINELRFMSTAIKALKEEIRLAEELIIQIAKGHEVQLEDLQRLGITQESSTARRLRLGSILSLRKTKLAELQTSHRKNRELLGDLLRCPACQGRGKITTVVYDRAEGRITQVTKTSECEVCGGTGKANLSDYTRDLIQSLQKKE